MPTDSNVTHIEPGLAEQTVWIRQPPGADQCLVDVRIPHGAKLTPEIRKSVDDLIRLLQANQETAAMSKGCDPNCVELLTGPCEILVMCRICNGPNG